MNSSSGQHKDLNATGSDFTEDSHETLCGQCKENIDKSIAADGFCNVCQVSLCIDCIIEHGKNFASRNHSIENTALSCEECLEKGETVSSKGYCSMCEAYLCENCITTHKTYKWTRDHSILVGQSMPRSITKTSSPKSSPVPTKPSKSTVNKLPKSSSVFKVSDLLPIKLLKPAQKIETHNIKSPDDIDDCWINSILILSSGKFIIADTKNNKLKLLDKKFQVCYTLEFTNYSQCDMCLSNTCDTQIFVTFPDEAAIYCISTTQAGGLHKERSIAVDGRCNGITCWTSGIAVTVRTREKMKFELELLDYDGMVLHRLNQNTASQLQFGNPFYLASIMDGQVVIISDYRLGQVIAVDTETKNILFTYSDNTLVGAHTVTTDNKDNIYVAGWKSNNVHVISSLGQRLQVILSEQNGLYYPKGLCYNRQNDTLVLQPNYDENKIAVYDVLNKQNS